MIAANHDKRNMRSAGYFRQSIDDIDVVRSLERDNCTKNNIFLDEYTDGISENFTDINFLKNIVIDGVSFLLVCLDANELYKDNAFARDC